MNRLAGIKYCGLLLLTFLVGCGGTGASTPAGEDPAPEPVSGQDRAISYDLMEEKWAVERVDTASSPWSVADCLEVSLPDAGVADFSYYFSAVEESCYYVLEDLVTGRDGQFEHSLYWTATDAASGKSAMEQWVLQAAPEAEKREDIDSLLEA